MEYALKVNAAPTMTAVFAHCSRVDRNGAQTKPNTEAIISARPTTYTIAKGFVLNT